MSDRNWFKSFLLGDESFKKDRSVLAMELTSKFKTDHYRKKYVQMLISNKTYLKGEWEKGNPNARRPVFEDATLNRDLQELDVDSLKQEQA